MDRTGAFALKKYSWKSLSPQFFKVISSNANDSYAKSKNICHHTSYIMLREHRNLALILF